MDDLSGLKTIVETISNAGLTIVALVVLFQMYREERKRVTDIQEKRIVENNDIQEKRIEDQKRTIDTLTAILTARGFVPNFAIGQSPPDNKNYSQETKAI